jgi:acid phosphatase
VFVIAMENEAAAAIYGSSSAPYINGQLIPRFARANAFTDPLPDAIPSEPHYVWMEAGTNAFSDVVFTGDADPSASNSTASTAHLTAQMGAAAPPVSWLSYQEGIGAATGACPIRSSGFYAAKHDPFVFFQDIVGSPPSDSSALCAAHHRPYTTAGFAADLQQRTVARYNFITPNLCNDMHGASGCPSSDVIQSGDDWLRDNLPPLIDFVSAQSGVIFIVWDEPVGGSNLIPFLAIGPTVKANYANQVHYTHGSLTKSVEEIFGLPILPTVAGENDLADLFTPGALP